MSFKTEVQADSTGTWAGNGLRFETEAEAVGYVADLRDRWTSVRKTRVIEADEPANYVWIGGQARRIEEIN